VIKMRFYKKILKECPVCGGTTLEPKTFETDIEGIRPVASIEYECETCHKKWRLTLRPTKIEFL
jgi:C4-type Zn-finger protein